MLITGAGSGIGRALALRCAELRARELLLWDRSEKALEESRQAILGQETNQRETASHQPAPLPKIRTFVVDVSEAGEIEEAARRIMSNQEDVPATSELQGSQGAQVAENATTIQDVPDILINCAGITTGDYFHTLRPDAIEQTIRVNVTGSMLVARAFLPTMIQRRSGHIVNIASASSYIGVPRLSVYAASKWAVLGWSESLRVEMKELGVPITITAILPSFINTGMFDGVKAPKLVPLLETEDIVEKILWSIEKRKTIVQAPFMVRAVPFLKVMLPQTAFDWVAGRLLGVYRSMDEFRGRG